MFQISEDWYELKALEEVCQKRIRKLKWMEKIQAGILDPDELESVKKHKGPIMPVIAESAIQEQVTLPKEDKADKRHFEDDLSSVLIDEDEMSVSRDHKSAGNNDDGLDDEDEEGGTTHRQMKEYKIEFEHSSGSSPAGDRKKTKS